MSKLRLIFILFILIFIIAVSIPTQILFNIAGFKLKKLYPLFFYKVIKIVLGININFDKAKLNKKYNGVLYIANHVSWFDIICLGTLLNARFIAKKEVAKMGIFGFLASLSNTFFIDNENMFNSWSFDVLHIGHLNILHYIYLTIFFPLMLAILI